MKKEIFKKSREYYNGPEQFHVLLEYVGECLDSNDVTPYNLDSELRGILGEFDSSTGIATNEKTDINYLKYFPKFIELVATPEFAAEFNERFAVLLEHIERITQEKSIESNKKRTIIDISKKDRVEVLMALVNSAFRIFSWPDSYITREQAQELLKKQRCFTSVSWLPMCIDFFDDTKFDTTFYNKHYGPNAAEEAIATCPDRY